MLKSKNQKLGGLLTLKQLPDPRCGPERWCSYPYFSEGLLEPSQRPSHCLKEWLVSCDRDAQAWTMWAYRKQGIWCLRWNRPLLGFVIVVTWIVWSKISILILLCLIEYFLSRSEMNWCLNNSSKTGLITSTLSQEPWTLDSVYSVATLYTSVYENNCVQDQEKSNYLTIITMKPYREYIYRSLISQYQSALQHCIFFLSIVSLNWLKYNNWYQMAPIANIDLFEPEVLTPCGSEIEQEREGEISSTEIPMTGVKRFEPLPYVKTILVTGGAGFM